MILFQVLQHRGQAGEEARRDPGHALLPRLRRLGQHPRAPRRHPRRSALHRRHLKLWRLPRGRSRHPRQPPRPLGHPPSLEQQRSLIVIVLIQGLGLHQLHFQEVRGSDPAGTDSAEALGKVNKQKPLLRTAKPWCNHCMSFFSKLYNGSIVVGLLMVAFFPEVVMVKIRCEDEDSESNWTEYFIQERKCQPPRHRRRFRQTEGFYEELIGRLTKYTRCDSSFPKTTRRLVFQNPNRERENVTNSKRSFKKTKKSEVRSKVIIRLVRQKLCIMREMKKHCSPSCRFILKLTWSNYWST